MKNIHILPTEKPSRFQKTKHDNFFLASKIELYTDCIAQHIYITSDEEIKEGDWYLSKGRTYAAKDNIEWCHKWKYKKIILTTDQDLIKDGVQSINDEFLEWFVKNPSCERVEVIKECCGQCDERLCEVYDLGREETRENTFYKIIIPKEEINEDEHYLDSYGCNKAEFELSLKHKKPKQEICNNCGKTLREQMKGCNEITCYRQFLSKQETLEEAYQIFLQKKYNNPHLTGNKLNLPSFEFGTKWQQERMYSEEEVISLLNDFAQHLIFNKNSSLNIIEWFEQFKKKI